MRDRRDNVVVVCSIENLDPMGVHTGDSITVAPAVTLTDREYQHMRDVGIAIIRAVGVDTGGCNIQFAVNPRDGRLIVIEMNPRVSRSSALASKATGFPIAKIAARLAIGYTLDEITNDITGCTPASFEPTLDYIVVKVPRFAFEKFPRADARLTTTMKSVGEAMAIGRNFAEALQKALRSLERPEANFSWPLHPIPADELVQAMRTPTQDRLQQVQWALAQDVSVLEVQQVTGIDPWFLEQIVGINDMAATIKSVTELDGTLIRRAKRLGFSDRQIADLRNIEEQDVRQLRDDLGIHPGYKTVDTCAAEFPAATPYHYSSYDDEDESEPTEATKVIILGSGPNRIGQGIEFDYCCVHAAMALRQVGIETIMVNCNPETVSTDYDTSDRLYFEPLTLEDVLEIVRAESARGALLGVIVQLGGQTPLGLAQGLADAGVPIIGTSPAAIHTAEERGAFGALLAKLGLAAPEHGMAGSLAEATAIADSIGYPVLVRPSYVLGGRGMEVVADSERLADYLQRAASVSPEHPVLVDRFLDSAIEIDVDAIFDGEELYLAGVMEHIEEAGIHSGDSACVLPTRSLTEAALSDIRRATTALARGIGVRGLINVQYAWTQGQLYVLEANPRASRTVPFVSKATGVAVAKAATLVMAGWTLAQVRAAGLLPAQGDGDLYLRQVAVAVKEAVLPFGRFLGADTILGPEMRSTGEVMGLADDFGIAFAKSQDAAYPGGLPTGGTMLVSLAERDRVAAMPAIAQLTKAGFKVLATAGTAASLAEHGIEAQVVAKHHDRSTVGTSRTAVSVVLDGEVAMVVNTPVGAGTRRDGYELRTAAVLRGIPSITTVQGLAAAVDGIVALQQARPGVRSLQEHAQALRERAAAHPAT